MSFSPPVVGCLFKKRLTKWGIPKVHGHPKTTPSYAPDSLHATETENKSWPDVSLGSKHKVVITPPRFTHQKSVLPFKSVSRDYRLSSFIIHQIFLLTCNWPKHVT